MTHTRDMVKARVTILPILSDEERNRVFDLVLRFASAEPGSLEHRQLIACLHGEGCEVECAETDKPGIVRQVDCR
jgi:hypothetical protein